MSNQFARNSLSRYGFSEINEYELPADQSITSGSPAVPVWILKGSDNMNGSLTLGIQGELNFQKDGVYLLSGVLVLQSQAVAAGYRECCVDLDTLDLWRLKISPINNETVYLPINTVAFIKGGQTIRIRFAQTGGVNLNLIGEATSSSSHCRLSIMRLY